MPHTTGLITLSLAYKALSNKDFDSAAKYFNSAQQDTSLTDLLKLVSTNESSAGVFTAPRVINNSENTSNLLIKLVSRKDPIIKAVSNQGSEYKHCKGENFYEDLLEEDSLINSPMLAELNTDPDLPDIIPLYPDDDSDTEGHVDMGEDGHQVSDADYWQDDPSEEELAEQQLAEQEAMVSDTLSSENTDEEDTEGDEEQ